MDYGCYVFISPFDFSLSDVGRLWVAAACSTEVSSPAAMDA
jgi:hypothetical protein